MVNVKRQNEITIKIHYKIAFKMYRIEKTTKNVIT